MRNLDDIELHASRLGQDHLLVITGGAAHIGAASVSSQSEDGVLTQTSAVPGHKEHVLTDSLAHKAAAQLGSTVVIIMGIHYDNLDQEEIREVGRISEHLVEEYIRKQKGE
ncbi:hypothetical protein [Paenibacillus pinistramenti]|uniref:prenylated flavin chaperone LpdD n=1 Tax=Paenibacillus pinistramenti TaxID=1768003 RepID=UPI001108DEA2|nr:hypothetical protein [Paenibacillus pinistramenti]